eukprot:TRINITY_DN2659_c0_g1_i2.p1 TRINITY_DN2659_c0_g1~~TRINITY_DN2659_c0_g1_i2.p1  ORF type:complete len:225 (-),score=59.41 TRINITY_DN2659_c0_g1_i2:71-745(-)
MSLSVERIRQSLRDGIIRLDARSLSDIPHDVQLAQIDPKINSVYLQNNAFHSIPERFFQGCLLLQTVNLSGNKFKTLPAALFHGLPSLTLVNLEKNELENVPVGLFHGCSKLKQNGVFFGGNPWKGEKADLFKEPLATVEDVKIPEADDRFDETSSMPMPEKQEAIKQILRKVSSMADEADSAEEVSHLRIENANLVRICIFFILCQSCSRKYKWQSSKKPSMC